MEIMKFGEKLNALRKARGLSQVELAEIVGVSGPRFSEWRYRPSEDVEISVAKLRRLAVALGVTLDYLADDTLDEPPPQLSESEARAVALIRALKLPEAIVLARLAGPQPLRALAGEPELDVSRVLEEPRRTAPPRSSASPASAMLENAPSDDASTKPRPPPARRRK